MKKKISDTKKAGEGHKNPVTAETRQANTGMIQHVELPKIVCKPFNPRKYRPEEDLGELKTSIANFGIIQPVTLRQKGKTYEIVCGERRYRASLMAGLSTIPAIIRDYSDEEAMEICILENLRRRDINPVEEALSFGKLMEVRGCSIDDLVKQFGKTDKYIRSRLQLRNLTDEIFTLLAREEITLGIALELSRFCPDIQRDVYREHLADDGFSWKHLQTKEFRRLLERGYSTDLSNYEFDKGECKGCRFNSAVYDLFADGNCGNCQNMECLRYKQAGYMASEATRLLSERKNAAISIAPGSFTPVEMVNNLVDTGCEIYEIDAARLPVEPQKPDPEQFETESEYHAAKESYETILQQYKTHVSQIETMIEKGKAQYLIDVSRQKPEVCYRVIPETEAPQPKENEKDTVEKLRCQDKRNRAIAIEKAVEDVKKLVKETPIPSLEFQSLEEGLLYYIMLSSLRKENRATLGFDTQSQPTDEEKADAIATLNDEQKDVIRRDFIVKHLSDTYGDCKQSHLLLEFASLHFPVKVREIKELYNEVYKKRHTRIEERIRQLQPFTDNPEPETVETDDIPPYPGVPEHAYVGDIPQEEEGLLNTVDEETAA